MCAKVPGCEAPTLKKGMCSKHYQRMQKYGSFDAPVRTKQVLRLCAVAGCEDEVKSGHKIYCRTHQRKMDKYGNPEQEDRKTGPKVSNSPVCTYEGCDKPTKSKNLCAMHVSRLARHGDVDALLRPWRNTEDTFWENIPSREEGNCWIWEGTFNPDGYGMFSYKDAIGGRIKETAWGAHVATYYFSHPGELWVEGVEICHSCDTRPCCNPEHLFISDHTGNMEDMRLKHRGTCKYTLAQEEAIFKEYSSNPKRGMKTLLAQKYGVTLATFNSILTRAELSILRKGK